jgi:hypothetical protein
LALIGLIAFLVGGNSLRTSMLIMSGILFGTTHVVPFGPLGMACFLMAAFLLEVNKAEDKIRVKAIADA